MKKFSETIIDFCAEEKENGLLLTSKEDYINFPWLPIQNNYLTF